MAKIVKKSPEQQKAEIAVKGFADDLGLLVIASDESRMAMVFADAREPDNPIIFTNDSFLTLTGFERREVLGQSFNFFLAQIANKVSLAKIETELAKPPPMAPKSSTDAGIAANSGQPCSSARFAMLTARSCSTSPPSSI
ncbi:MAG: PAS domain-containing protein [Candidatus Devosia symbiotica]|nr:PAS domain-containing protein [Candidatus Devosia symbiotica]